MGTISQNSKSTKNSTLHNFYPPILGVVQRMPGRASKGLKEIKRAKSYDKEEKRGGEMRKNLILTDLPHFLPLYFEMGSHSTAQTDL